MHCPLALVGDRAQGGDEVGLDAPQIKNMISLYKEGQITEITGLETDFADAKPVVTSNHWMILVSHHKYAIR